MTRSPGVTTSSRWADRTRRPTRGTSCACGAVRRGASSLPMRAAARWVCLHQRTRLLQLCVGLWLRHLALP